MHPYQFLPHTADVRMYVEAEQLTELFKHATQGMSAYLYGDEKRPTGAFDYERIIECQSTDLTGLLVDFLNDVLSLSQIDYVLFEDVKIELSKEHMVSAHLFGRKVEGFAEDIKAVTYHEAEVKQTKEKNWQAKVIFDI